VISIHSIINKNKNKLQTFKINLMKKIIFFNVIVAIITLSCKKETTNPPKDESKTKVEILTSTNWIISEYIKTGDDDSYKNIYESMYDCNRDNEIVFDSNGDYFELAGNSKCDPSDSDIIYQSTWVVNNDTTEIEFFSENYNINFISEDSLRLINSYYDSDSEINYTHNIKYISK
jgi:hypothetical protein